MNYEKLSAMLSGISNGGAKSLVRVGGYDDRPGIQQSPRSGSRWRPRPLHQHRRGSPPRHQLHQVPHRRHALGVLSAAQHEQSRTARLRRQLEQRRHHRNAVETASCIENIVEIAAVPGVDILFLGQNDLCMSMGLYNKYEFPHMYTSPELNAATQKLIEQARKNNVILGIFLFGTSRVGEFLDKGFTFISVGNDLHHVLTQTGAYVNDIETSRKKKAKPGREGRPRCSSFRFTCDKGHLVSGLAFCFGEGWKVREKDKGRQRRRSLAGLNAAGVGYAVAVARKPPVPHLDQPVEPGKLKIA